MREQRGERAANAAIGPTDLASGAIGKRTLVDAALPPPAPGAASPSPGRGGPPVVQAKTAAANADESPRPSHNLSELSKTAIEELDGDKRKKVLLATMLSTAKLHELPAFTALLKAAPDSTHGIFLINELQDDYGSQATVSILQAFADAGINITAKLDTYDLQPLAAVATFRPPRERRASSSCESC